MKNEPPKRGSSGRSGAFSVLVSHRSVYSPVHKFASFNKYLHDVFFALQGDPQNDGQTDRPKRSTQKRSAAK